MIEGPVEGVEVRGVGCSRGCFLRHGQRDSTAWVDGSREAQWEEAVGHAEYTGSDVRASWRNGGSVRVRGRGLGRSKEGWLGSREGGRPISNRRGYRTRNLLRGGLLADFLLVLAA